MKTILVINMGMKSIRAIIFDSEGNKLASSALPIETSLTGDMVTQNPIEWWEKAEKIIQDVISKVGIIKIDYITVTTSAACLVCVDKEGNPLLPCIMVSDKRAKAESRQLEENEAFVQLKQTQLDVKADPSYLIPKTLWIKNNRPEIYEKIYKLLTPNDYLLYRFTGEYVTDYINARKWYCDSESKEYPGNLLKTLEIKKDLLPNVVSPGEYIGNISTDVAKKLGLSPDAKVIASTYDAICSFIGSGTLDDGEANDVSGTVTVFRTATRKNISRQISNIQLIPFHEAGLQIIGGSNNMGGGLIEWVKQCYYNNEQLPYELMEKDASEARLGAGGLIFLPYLLGERAPIWDYEARGVFFGLERSHTRREMTRAVFESTGFIDLDMISAIEDAGVEVRSIRASGGLARLNLISQIKADVTGKEVKVLSEFETTATGAAVIALFGQGIYDSLEEACDTFAQIRMIIRPDRKSHDKYLDIYKLYKETYQTLKPLFPKRNALADTLNNHTKVKVENL